MDSHQPPPGFFPMPFPFFPPPQHHTPSERIDKVPARVLVAVEVLQHFTSKTAVIPLPCKTSFENDISFEAIPGQKLTLNEQGVQDAACDLLSLYFQGRLKFSKLELMEVDRIKGPKKEEGEALFHCHLCGGGPNRSRCRLCNGSGALIIRPAFVGDEESGVDAGGQPNQQTPQEGDQK